MNRSGDAYWKATENDANSSRCVQVKQVSNLILSSVVRI